MKCRRCNMLNPPGTAVCLNCGIILDREELSPPPWDVSDESTTEPNRPGKGETPPPDPQDVEELITTQVNAPPPPEPVEASLLVPTSPEDFPEIEKVDFIPNFSLMDDETTVELDTKPYRAYSGTAGGRPKFRADSLSGRVAQPATLARATKARPPEQSFPILLTRVLKRGALARHLTGEQIPRLLFGVLTVALAVFFVIFVVLLSLKAGSGDREGGSTTPQDGLSDGAAAASRPDGGTGTTPDHEKVPSPAPEPAPGKLPHGGSTNPLLKKLPKVLHLGRVFFQFDRIPYGGATFFVDNPARVYPSAALAFGIKKGMALADVTIGATGPAVLGSFSTILFDAAGFAHGPAASGEKFVLLPAVEGQSHIFWESVSEVPPGQTVHLHRAFLIPENLAENLILEIGHESIEGVVWITISTLLIPAD
jgi:hypothetical protein